MLDDKLLKQIKIFLNENISHSFELSSAEKCDDYISGSLMMIVSFFGKGDNLVLTIKKRKKNTTLYLHSSINWYPSKANCIAYKLIQNSILLNNEEE